jgi:hypothetical protein
MARHSKKIETEKIKPERKATFKVEPHAFGFRAGIDLDKFNQLADELEVEEIARRLSLQRQTNT